MDARKNNKIVNRQQLDMQWMRYIVSNCITFIVRRKHTFVPLEEIKTAMRSYRSIDRSPLVVGHV